ncbi:MAG: MBL fold metallo-hydrolase, partial [Anaerolineae bacterium]
KVGSLEVIATPGHTPGHVAYFDQRDRTLIAGDAYSTQAGIVTGGSLRLLFPFHAIATWSKPLALRSGEVMRDLKPSRLAVGHGAVIENPLAAMDGAIAEAKHNLSRNDHVTQKAR